jgi:hypothetical protein|tara:strand:+ start:1251 stop:1376 length:126 start_codon:yes stop_codon:yes gene_type:complete
MKNDDLIQILNDLRETMKNMKSTIDHVIQWIELIIENKRSN